jgi:hypothetical protein
MALHATKLTASGSIEGLERTLVGNCPGGEHGELVLKGTYQITSVNSSANQVLLTYSGKVFQGQLVAIPIPQDANKSPERCTIVVSGASGSTTAVVEFGAEEPSKVSQYPISNKGRYE